MAVRHFTSSVACSSLPLLTTHFVAESVAPPTRRVLLFKMGSDRTAIQAAERLAVASGSFGKIAVVNGGGHGRTEPDAVVLAVQEVSSATTSVAATRAAHDVAELDASGFVVPETESDDEQGDGTECHGEGNDESLALGDVTRGRGIQGGLGNDDGELDSVHGRCGGVLDLVPDKLQGDIVGAMSPEMAALNLEWEEAVSSRLRLLQDVAIGFFARRLVEVVDAERDEARLVGRLVEPVGIPGNVVRIVNVDARIVPGPTEWRIWALLVVASRKGTLVCFGIGRGRIGRRLRSGVDVAIVGDGVDRGRQVVRSSVDGRWCSADGSHGRRKGRSGCALVVNGNPGCILEVVVVVAIARPETIGSWNGHGGAAEGEGSAQEGSCVHGAWGKAAAIREE